MKLIYLLISLCAFSAYGQKMPPIIFNHFYLDIDSADILALKQAVTDDGLATFVTRTTYRKVDTFTNSYLYGKDNYFEIRGAYDGSEGFSGLAFGVEKTGSIIIADTLLKKKYQTVRILNEKADGDTVFPWYSALFIVDSVFFSQTDVFFWMMEYRSEYFDYYHFPYRQGRITATDFIRQYAVHRKNKDLLRYTAMTLNVTALEKKFYTALFQKFGYKESKENTFKAPGNFVFHFRDKQAEEKYSVTCLEFKTRNKVNKTIFVSKNIKILMNKGKGKILFGAN